MKKIEIGVIGIIVLPISLLFGYHFLMKYPNLIFDFSGYDPFLLSFIKHPIDSIYATVRHPLISVYMLAVSPFYMIIKHNIVITVFISFFYFLSNVILYLTLRYNIKNSILHSILLLLLFNSFAYIIPMSFIPDSYPLSLFALLLSIYYFTLEKQKENIKVFYLLFFLTAGITITNGIKILLVWVFKGKNYKETINKLIKPVVIFFIVISSIWIVSKKINSLHTTTPKYEIINENQQAKHDIVSNSYTPGFMSFIDTTTPFFRNISENFIGESILFHPISLELDPVANRPQFIKYKRVVDYVVVWSLFLLFIFSLIYKNKNKFIKYIILFFSVDIFIHLVARFGFNEIFIFGPHWLFLIPISFGILLKESSNLTKKLISFLLSFFVVYLCYFNYSALLFYFHII